MKHFQFITIPSSLLAKKEYLRFQRNWRCGVANDLGRKRRRPRRRIICNLGHGGLNSVQQRIDYLGIINNMNILLTHLSFIPFPVTCDAVQFGSWSHVWRINIERFAEGQYRRNKDNVRIVARRTARLSSHLGGK